MDEKGTHREANLGRLFKAAVGGEARLRDSHREEIHELLMAALRPRGAKASFPDGVLALLGGAQVLAALWLGTRVFSVGLSGPFQLPDLLLALPVLVNLSCVPLAAMVILKRNRCHAPEA